MRKTSSAPSQILRGGPLLAFVYLAVLLVCVPAVWMVSGDDAFTAMAVLVGVALACLAIFEMRRVGHPLTPAGLAALGGILIFALRPLTVTSSGSTTPGALLDVRPFAAATVTAGTVSLWQVALFYACFGVAYFVMMGKPATIMGPRFPLSPVLVRRTGILLAFVTVLAVACALALIQSSGGLGAHFSGVSVRSSFLAGRYYLTLSYIPLTIALALYCLSRRYAGLKEWDGGALLAAAILCGVGFTTGGRGPLLLGVIVPLLILKQTGPSRLRPRTLALIGVALIVGAMVMSLFLREGVYDEGASIRELQSDPVTTLMSRLMSGAETRPFDSLILLNEMDAANRVPVLYGSTYLSVAMWFIPGELAPWKDGGANTWFTRTFIPRFYYPDHIETSVSAIGEAFANFRYIGIVLVAVLLAVTAAKVSVNRSGDGLVKVLLSISLTPLYFSFIRGDAFQNLSTVVLVLGITGLFLWMTGATRLASTAARTTVLGRQHPTSGIRSVG